MSEAKRVAGKVITRSMASLRKHPRFKELLAKKQGFITDLSGNHTVGLQWGLNETADQDGIFKLTVDDKEVYIDLEELTYYTRVMFTKTK